MAICSVCGVPLTLANAGDAIGGEAACKECRAQFDRQSSPASKGAGDATPEIKVPAYGGMVVCASVFRIIGVLSFAAAVWVLVSNIPDPVQRLVFCLGSAAYGITMFGGAALLAAIRDMARNSFTQRILLGQIVAK
jgi:hypothetical protein